jgi:hypothetical protein
LRGSNRVGAVGAALCVALLLALLGAGRAPAANTDPYAIFANARSYWEHQRYPERLAFTVAVVVQEAGTQKVEHYTSTYDAVDNVITTDCVSDYERAHPPSGKGIKFNAGISSPTIPLTLLAAALPQTRSEQTMASITIGHSGDPAIDFLGVPELAPNYSFGIAPFVPGRAWTSAELVAKIRAKFHDPGPSPSPSPTPAPTPTSSGLKQIAVVTAVARHYIISLVGIEPLDGAPAYHLKLQAVVEPHRYRLRDLWIDTQTYATRQLISDGNFTNGPWPGAPWTVRFAQIDGATYIADESAAQAFEYGNLRYTATAVDMQDVSVPQGQQLPSYCRPSAADILSEPTV